MPGTNVFSSIPYETMPAKGRENIVSVPKSTVTHFRRGV